MLIRDSYGLAYNCDEAYCEVVHASQDLRFTRKQGPFRKCKYQERGARQSRQSCQAGSTAQDLAEPLAKPTSETRARQDMHGKHGTIRFTSTTTFTAPYRLTHPNTLTHRYRGIVSGVPRRARR